MPVITRQLELDKPGEDTLRNYVEEELRRALEVHEGIEQRFARYKRAYKALPEVEKKTFPWDGASNIVIPHVGTAVDAIVAKMMGAIFSAEDFAEVKILNKDWEPLEKKIRDWITAFITNSSGRDRLREMFHDSAQDGDAFVEPRWVEEMRVWHSYAEDGSVVEQNIPAYIGVRFFAFSADTVIHPQGFDNWGTLPWFATLHRFTYDELLTLEKDGVFRDVSELKSHKKERSDLRYEIVQKSQGASGGISQTYEIYQIRGRFPIPQAGLDEPAYEEVMLAYSLDARKFVQTIYNPYFGKFRHLVKVPFLVQPHEVRSMGVAEQVIQFQEIASTAYNQVVDSATAANAGLVVTDPDSSIAKDGIIHPGKIIISDNPDKTKIIHLSEPSPALQQVVEFAGRMQQVRSAVSDYSLGLESTVVGSRATATGTTALIGQGNIRFSVSINEMRAAIEELIYLTIQQEQQFRPEGTPLPDGSILTWPKTDPRLGIGLKIRLTSEQVNREAEIQSFQLLFQMLNEYYMRFMQAIGLIINPAFPPPLKAAAILVLNASQNIMKRMVERFSIENIDEVVPGMMQAMEAMMGVANAGQGMGGPPAGGPAALPPASGGPPNGGAPPNGGSPGQPGAAPMPGGSQIVY